MGAIASQITSFTIVYSTVLFRRRSKKRLKLCVTGLCMGNSQGTGEFPAQMASNAENVSIWWRHHGRKHFHIMTPSCHIYTEFSLLFIKIIFRIFHLLMMLLIYIIYFCCSNPSMHVLHVRVDNGVKYRSREGKKVLKRFFCLRECPWSL